MVVKFDWSLFYVRVVETKPDLPPLKGIFFIKIDKSGSHDIICTMLWPVKIYPSYACLTKISMYIKFKSHISLDQPHFLVVKCSLKSRNRRLHILVMNKRSHFLQCLFFILWCLLYIYMLIGSMIFSQSSWIKQFYIQREIVGWCPSCWLH